MNQQEKDLLMSSNFWGLIVTFASMYLTMKGITLPFDHAALVNNLATVAGLVLNVIGRTKAKKAVTKVAGIPLPGVLKAKQ